MGITTTSAQLKRKATNTAVRKQNTTEAKNTVTTVQKIERHAVITATNGKRHSNRTGYPPSRLLIVFQNKEHNQESPFINPGKADRRGRQHAHTAL